LPPGTVTSVSCPAGKGACPPEDCGGAWGYASLKEVLADPDHEEHEDLLDWLGLDSAADFDPARFSLDEVNAGLSRLL
jgi:Plasmid pRiA4b ORF-3-like protein